MIRPRRVLSLSIVPALCLLCAATAWSRSVEIVLDASGSMAAALPGGQTKIEAAKKALAEVLAGIPDTDLLALRAYGHQSPTAAKDCRDTALLAPFAPAAQNRAAAAKAAMGLTPRGYTPITYVLGLAAADFPPGGEDERTIVLVSDGKETCAGDPCAAAKALAASGARLVIHVVGFDVDAQAKAQLDCVARATGGTYRSAADAASLAGALGQAAREPAAPEKVKVLALPKNDPGNLVLKGADLSGHQVTEAATGKEVARLSSTGSAAKLPPGIYNVTVGKGVWKSVEVRPGETTTLVLARLGIKGASLGGHPVTDPETGEEAARPSSTGSSAALMPGRYNVLFGQVVWPVELAEGQTLELRPGSITVHGASIQGFDVLTRDGLKAGTVSPTASTLPLPPGDYVLKTPAGDAPFSLTEGERVEFK